MNTSYYENLNSTVKELLSSLELEQSNLQSQKDNAKVAHDQAYEAVAAAQHRSGSIGSLLESQQSTIDKLQEPLFISTAILSSATEANACTKKAVTTTSVAASNIQVAANAIVRLASDVGSVHSILQASVPDTELSRQAETMNTLMNKTAYGAETSSQLAMDASAFTSEIIAPSIANKAKNVNVQLVDLLKGLVAENNATKDQQQSIASGLGEVIHNEKQAQQELEKVTALADAAQETYLFTVKALTLKLQEQSTASTETVIHHSISNKEQDLRALKMEVFRAQQETNKCQEIITALTAKMAMNEEYLNTVEAYKKQAGENKTLGDQLMLSVFDLGQNSGIALNKAKDANEKSNEAAKSITTTMNLLVSAGKAIDELHALIIKTKAVNPLVSEELINMADAACKDASKTISLGLVALKSAFEAVANNTETEAIMELEHAQFMTLCEVLTKEKDPKKVVEALEKGCALASCDDSCKEEYLKKLNPLCLQAGLYHSYGQFSADGALAKTSLTKATSELSVANGNLKTSQITLTSLEAGLTAAKAAANSH